MPNATSTSCRPGHPDSRGASHFGRQHHAQHLQIYLFWIGDIADSPFPAPAAGHLEEERAVAQQSRERRAFVVQTDEVCERNRLDSCPTTKFAKDDNSTVGRDDQYPAPDEYGA